MCTGSAKTGGFHAPESPHIQLKKKAARQGTASFRYDRFDVYAAGAATVYSLVSDVFCCRRLRWIIFVVHDCAQTAVI